MPGLGRIDCMQRVSIAEAKQLACDVLYAYGTSISNAANVADALVHAEIDGQRGHGLARLPTYVKQLQAGKVIGDACPTISSHNSNLVKIDAGYGFAFPALSLAINKLIVLAPNHAVSCATVSHSHHFGQAGYHVEQLAQAGFVALMFGNAPKAIAPWGAISPLFGTNPIAFAAPRIHNPPLVIDVSMSSVARGKILRAWQEQRTIPDDWALDSAGMPTTDPQAALAGSVLPIGGAKGSALALMVEIISAALIGTHFAFEASSFFDGTGEAPNVGQLLLVCNVQYFSGDNFFVRLEACISAIEAQEGARLPGSKRLHNRKNAAAGLAIDEALYDQLQKLRHA